jgi:hypothetical protein
VDATRKCGHNVTQHDQREGSHVSPSLSFPLSALLSPIPKMTPHLPIAPPAWGITCRPSAPAMDIQGIGRSGVHDGPEEHWDTAETPATSRRQGGGRMHDDLEAPKDPLDTAITPVLQSAITMPTKNFFPSSLAPTRSTYPFLYTTCKRPSSGTMLNCHAQDSCPEHSTHTLLNCNFAQTLHDMPSGLNRGLGHLGHLSHLGQWPDNMPSSCTDSLDPLGHLSHLSHLGYPSLLVKLPRGLSVRLECFQVMAIVWEWRKMLPAELR